MYADQITTGRKRSIKDRIDGDSTRDFARGRNNGAKRQRQTNDKWKHDLFQDQGKSQSSTIGPRDLRLKLQKKEEKQTSGVRDLREKLSGVVPPRPQKAEPAAVLIRPKPVSEITKPARYNPAVEATQAVPKPASSKEPLKQPESPSVDSFLSSLGLEKYSLTFQAEEVDMTALVHMTDADLKALGVPMGPRKKILLALESKA
ncbi:SAM domain protein [Rhynchospora pubera]|uniref:SAM domain protein n=1 Tax=Rhynchospora pubera TaxID=906938 RepID=A0AAV8C1P9_9POAL|nr:SAM domain protein [Rhynchospora pubera]